MSFADLLAADRRLVCLKCLDQAPGYELNTYVLRTALASMGHSVSLDLVKADAAWLAEQGLAEVSEVGTKAMPVTVLKITPRGADVAAGRCTHPGVKRPEPGE